ncbi:alpha/beta hydrolase [Lewinella sp. IMCC34183]|uniref:alpha/beta hydrolase n=1 Tax=Lewinella sp. IMCC34183 TaxID=2248762 RepID=UPI000E221217|nr:alpha/beta hydrolase [Lewinella sp. IMCC34183]
MTEEFSWKNEQGLRLYAVDWRQDAPRAVLGVIHGLGEHCRRYDGLADFFNRRGFAVVGYDRQGFGRSEGRKGYTADYRNYLDGVAQLRVQCERRYPGVPVFLYGHSMGGQLLLQYLIHRKPTIRGAILSAPHIAEAFRPNPVVVAVGKLMRRIYPTFTLSNQVDATKLSRNPSVVEDYRADPFVHDRLSSQTGIDLLERAAALRAYAGPLPVPALLIHGTGDAITSHAESAAFAARSPGVSFRSYAGAYHELHHEPEREAILSDVADWIDGQLA